MTPKRKPEYGTVPQRPTTKSLFGVISMVILVLFLTIISLSPRAASDSRTYHVNANSGRDNNNGLSSKSPWSSLSKANEEVRPGDTVYIHPGTYREKIRPATSGTPEKPIIYRATIQETVVIEGVDILIDLSGRSFVTIQGITFQSPGQAWGIIRNGHHNRIVENRFLADGRRRNYIGLQISDGSTYNHITNNDFRDWGEASAQWGDAVRLGSRSDYNLVGANTFLNAGHALLAVETSYNVIRHNYFENAWQKGIDLVWRVNPSWAPGEEFIARRNVIENNTFVKCQIASDQQNGGVGIQIAAAETIFRGNLLVENERTGVIINGWEDAPRAFGNRLYHNTFIFNGTDLNQPHSSGLFITQWGDTRVDLRGNVFKNNVFHGDVNQTSQIIIDLWPEQQYNAAFFGSYRIAGNCFSANPRINIDSLDGSRLVEFYQDRYPEFVAQNQSDDSALMNLSDYRLRPDSPCAYTAVPLTSTTSAGEGQTIPVVDASYFCDGYGLKGGDAIRLGANTKAVVLDIDYAANLLKLDRPIQWLAGDPVYLGDFEGARPMPGASAIVLQEGR